MPLSSWQQVVTQVTSPFMHLSISDSVMNAEDASQAAGATALEVVQEHSTAPELNQATEAYGPQPKLQGGTEDDTDRSSNGDQQHEANGPSNPASDNPGSRQQPSAEGQARPSQAQSVHQAPRCICPLSKMSHASPATGSILACITWPEHKWPITTPQTCEVCIL